MLSFLSAIAQTHLESPRERLKPIGQGSTYILKINASNRFWQRISGYSLKGMCTPGPDVYNQKETSVHESFISLFDGLRRYNHQFVVDFSPSKRFLVLWNLLVRVLLMEW